MNLLPMTPVPQGGVPERRDAARNRLAILEAARALIRDVGASRVTMDAVALRAGVGKATVSRHFGGKAGLMLGLLSDSEATFQKRYIFGPPPLGPGAPPVERLVAFGAERMAFILEFGEVLRAADLAAGHRLDVPAAVLVRRHLSFLLRAAGVPEADIQALFLSAIFDAEVLQNSGGHGQERVRALQSSWQVLVTGLVAAAAENTLGESRRPVNDVSPSCS